MAGAAFVQVVSGHGPVERWGAVSVARRDGGDGDVEIRAHRDSDAAVAYCEVQGYEAAVIWSTWRVGGVELAAAAIHVLGRDGECMRALGCVDCLVRLRPTIVVKIAEIDVRDEYFAAFLDGFGEGVALDVPPRFTPREDARRLGVAVGEALAGELARLIDGEEPTTAIGIRMLPGADAAVTRSAAALGIDWDHDCATRQGATIQRGAGILVIGVPSQWGSSCLLLYALEVSRTKGQVRTSTIAGAVSNADELSPDGMEFLAGLHAGIGGHPRAADVLAGFGALGPYRRRDELWEQPVRDRLLRPFRQAWHRFRDVSLFQRSKHEKIKKLGIPRDPAKTYRVFDGDVYAMPNLGSDNVIVISSEQSDYELVCTTGITPELGYVYFLDGDGDLSRRRL